MGSVFRAQGPQPWSDLIPQLIMVKDSRPPIIPAMPRCFLDTKTEYLKGLNINQAPRPSLLLTRSRGPLQLTASTGGLMEQQRGLRSQLALSAMQTPPGSMRVMISKRTLLEEKQRASNSLLSHPNLSQRRHIIKTLALNHGLSNP